MSSALVLAERGSGLTTFVGLLYVAQVRLGTEESDEFRFSADRESIRRIGEIYTSLLDGRFPGEDVDWESPPLSFVFGFRRGRLSGYAHRPVAEDGDFDTVRVQVGSLPADEVAELNDHDAVLGRGTRRLLRSPIVVPLIDGSWLTPDASSIGRRRLARYDRVLAGTLTLLGKFLAAETNRRARRMYPLFVLTKFDQVAPDALRQWGAPNASPEDWTAEGRAEFGQRMLREFLPQTAQLFARSGAGAILHGAIEWYFSGLRTEERAGETRIVRRVRSPLSGWEPEYPYAEYASLLRRVGGLARHLPDEIEA